MSAEVGQRAEAAPPRSLSLATLAIPPESPFVTIRPGCAVYYAGHSTRAASVALPPFDAFDRRTLSNTARHMRSFERSARGDYGSAVTGH